MALQKLPLFNSFSFLNSLKYRNELVQDIKSVLKKE